MSYVLPVKTKDDSTRILKIQWPHPECEHEAAALKEWDGRGAIRLIEHDEPRHALLLERCTPGDYLAGGADDPMTICAGLIKQLLIETNHPFKTLPDQAREWIAFLDAQRSSEEGEVLDLIDRAITLGEGLMAASGPHKLLHQDLHGQNILSAERQPWLAIDPKPLVGEVEFSIAPVVRSFEFGFTRDEVVQRLDDLSDALELDRERAKGWTILQTMAWSFDSSFKTTHHQTVKWLLDEAK